jgi:hypothetical protein
MIASQQPVRSADERETSGASTTAPDKEANNDKESKHHYYYCTRQGDGRVVMHRHGKTTQIDDRWQTVRTS